MKILLLTIPICFFGLLGCTKQTKLVQKWIPDHAKDYETTKEYSPIRVPKGVHAEAFSDRYGIPKDSA